jgi:hypothetical protein
MSPTWAGEIAKKLGNALVYPTMPFAPTGSNELRTGHMRNRPKLPSLNECRRRPA